MSRPSPRNVKGFRDLFSDDLLLKQRLIDAVRKVYESYGFVPLETPAVEFVDVLGKFLPEAHTPEGGIFSFQNPDVGSKVGRAHPDYWISMRYDLTAPLARVVAQYQQHLPRPFRRYQIGPVWRLEKPGLGRYREFFQFDFDSVGVPSVAADAEACAIMCDVFNALGFETGEYIVKVNNRKVMQGILEVCGLDDTNVADETSQAAAILRSIDKLDRLGMKGVRELLAEGRRDKTGDFTEGAKLSEDQITLIAGYLSAQSPSRSEVCDRVLQLIEGSEIGREGVHELRVMDSALGGMGYGDDRVSFDPTIIRGLSYYTGPVFEGQLTVPIVDSRGRERHIGTVFGGGRYDDLIERFTGQKVPATGASIGLDRLLEAIKLLGRWETRTCTSDVLVTLMDNEYLPKYFDMANEIRGSGINVEVFLGKARIGRQLKYADQMGIPVAVIAGPDEFLEGQVQVKDLRAGMAQSSQISEREQWRETRPGQAVVAQSHLVDYLRELLGKE